MYIHLASFCLDKFYESFFLGFPRAKWFVAQISSKNHNAWNILRTGLLDSIIDLKCVCKLSKSRSSCSRKLFENWPSPIFLASNCKREIKKSRKMISPSCQSTLTSFKAAAFELMNKLMKSLSGKYVLPIWLLILFSNVALMSLLMWSFCVFAAAWNEEQIKHLNRLFLPQISLL